MMNNLIAESIKDLEFILTEWEGDTNALLGAVRVNARLDRITPILTAIAEKTREDTEGKTVYQCSCCGFRSDGILVIHDCSWTNQLRIRGALK